MGTLLFNIFPLGGNDCVSFMCADAQMSMNEVANIAAKNKQHLFAIEMGCMVGYYVMPICACNPLIAVAHEYASENNKEGSLFCFIESLLSVGKELYETKQKCFDGLIEGHRVFVEAGKTTIVGSDEKIIHSLREKYMLDHHIKRFYNDLLTKALSAPDMEQFVLTFVSLGEKVTARILQGSAQALVTQN